MKLTKKEIEKVSGLYDLGKVRSAKHIPGGMINYNFNVKTDKGNFIVRKLGYKLNSWWGNKKELEFGVIEYLYKKRFPYQIPKFIKNKNGNYISKVDRALFEVYERIPGRKIVNLNNKQFKEMVKALATYHKIMKNFPLKKKFSWSDDNKWMLEKYALVRKVKPKTKVDRLMLKHLDFYEDLLKKLLKINIQQDCLVTHSDFSVYNLLWKNNELVGVLDFENLGYKPKLFDIAYVWKGDNRKKMLVDTYLKYNSLSKKEENNIIIYKLLQNCNMFWWSYLGMDKRPELKYRWIQRTLRYGIKYVKMWDQTKN